MGADPAVPPACAGLPPQDGGAFCHSDAARSRVAELVRTISSRFAAGAAAIRREATAFKAEGSRNEKLRVIWSKCLADDIKAKAHNMESIRISREKGEVWIYRPDDGGKHDPPADASYRLERQPSDFEGYMKSWETSTKGFDLSIEHLLKSIARLD